MTTSVLLRLEGPLQSWGTRSRFADRDTEAEPSKSGVLGLVGAALGMARTDEKLLEVIADCRMAVRIDRNGSALRDYHTVGGGVFLGSEHRIYGEKNPVITNRHYLQDASFLVALAYEDDNLANRIDVALGSPVWPLALGRRACPPSLPVRAGVLHAVGAESALRAAEWPSRRRPEMPVRLVIECEPSHPEAQARQDHPLSFRPGSRHYARRFVRVAHIDPQELELLSQEKPCISLAAC